MPAGLVGFTRSFAIVLSVPLIIAGTGAASASQLSELSRFTGPYIGLQLGYGATTLEIDVDVAGFQATEEINEGGLNGGIFAGYSGVAGRLFGGVELDASLSNAEYKESSGGVEASLEQNFTLGASGLIGFLAQDNLLLYSRFGYVYTEFEARLSDGVSSARDTEGFHGFRAGAGADVALSEHISVRAEYAYTTYKSRRFSEDGDSVSFKPWEHLGRIGVAYRF